MKVVLFCGGLGTRIRDYSEETPKPMVPIGYRPILWHVMKYYASFGHKDFILCLGYKADYIKNYFLNYDECQSNDFRMTEGGRNVVPLEKDIEDWNILFIDTGYSTNIGGRLRAVREHLEGEEYFLANYSDNLTDVHLPTVIDNFKQSDHVGSFVCVRPKHTFHVVSMGEDSLVRDIHDIRGADVWINGGYFVLRPSIFDYMKPGEELVMEPFRRLIDEKRLIGYKHDGFWMSMETFKDKQLLDSIWEEGKAPWARWQPGAEDGR